jgi:hypothetical protein
MLEVDLGVVAGVVVEDDQEVRRVLWGLSREARAPVGDRVSYVELDPAAELIAHRYSLPYSTPTRRPSSCLGNRSSPRIPAGILHRNMYRRKHCHAELRGWGMIVVQELRRGVPIADAFHDEGYFHQPHMTRSLRRWAARRPK